MTNSLSTDIEDNYDLFIADAINTGCVWGLEGEEGWALCASQQYDETPVMPFWSQPDFAQIHCEGDWKNYRVVPVALEEFLDEWLPGMHTDVILVGINWDQSLEGAEYEPIDLLKVFEDGLR